MPENQGNPSELLNQEIENIWLADMGTPPGQTAGQQPAAGVPFQQDPATALQQQQMPLGIDTQNQKTADRFQELLDSNKAMTAEMVELREAREQNDAQHKQDILDAQQRAAEWARSPDGDRYYGQQQPTNPQHVAGQPYSPQGGYGAQQHMREGFDLQSMPDGQAVEYVANLGEQRAMQKMTPWMQQMQQDNYKTRRDFALAEARRELTGNYEDFDVRKDFRTIEGFLDKGLTPEQAYGAAFPDRIAANAIQSQQQQHNDATRDGGGGTRSTGTAPRVTQSKMDHLGQRMQQGDISATDEYFGLLDAHNQRNAHAMLQGVPIAG